MRLQCYPGTHISAQLAGGHQADISHEILAGAAAFAAARAYEAHVAANGQPPSHAVAKELLYVCGSLLASY
jgi:hypothetical protein